MKKNFLFYVLWVLLSCLLAILFFLLVELSIRKINPEFLKDKILFDDINWYCIFDENLGWTYRKNAKGLLYGVPFAINNEGYRGDDIRFDNKIKKRILMLGDSITFGFGVRNSETFSEILNDDETFNFEVINSGVCGYGTDQEFLLYKKYSEKIQPDWVILNLYLGNDRADIDSPHCLYDSGFFPKPIFIKKYTDNYSLYVDHMKLPLWKRVFYELNYRSYFYNYIRYLVNSDFQEEVLANLPKDVGLIARNDNNLDSSNKKLIYLINQINLLCKENGHNFLVFIFPGFDMVRIAEEESFYYELIESFQENKIMFADFFREANITESDFPDIIIGEGYHLNQKGHSMVAKIIKNLILKIKEKVPPNYQSGKINPITTY